jgi:DedD protein
MEKKKLLIVAVSVGVVLLIIIAIPLLMIGSRQNLASAALVERDWSAAPEPNIVLSSGTVTDTQNYANTIQPDENVSPQPEESPHITLTVPVPQTAAVPDTSPAQTQKPSALTLTPSAKPAPAKPAAKPATPAPATKPAADSSKKTNNNYWVQTGAFSTKIRAEGAKESLASKGITSIIDNRNIDGKTWYRVRVGPYMSENEAKYWLALVKSIDGFTDSQIRQTQVQ